MVLADLCGGHQGLPSEGLLQIKSALHACVTGPCNLPVVEMSSAFPPCRKAHGVPGSWMVRRTCSGTGLLTGVCDCSFCPPGHCPLGGEQAQHDQPLPCAGAGRGEVCVCPAIQAHPDTRLRQPPAGPVVSAAAAEQASGEWTLVSDGGGSVLCHLVSPLSPLSMMGTLVSVLRTGFPRPAQVMRLSSPGARGSTRGKSFCNARLSCPLCVARGICESLLDPSVLWGCEGEACCQWPVCGCEERCSAFRGWGTHWGCVSNVNVGRGKKATWGYSDSRDVKRNPQVSPSWGAAHQPSIPQTLRPE